MTTETKNAIILIAQQMTDKQSGLHTGKMTLDDFIEACCKVAYLVGFKVTDMNDGLPIVNVFDDVK